MYLKKSLEIETRMKSKFVKWASLPIWQRWHYAGSIVGSTLKNDVDPTSFVS